MERMGNFILPSRRLQRPLSKPAERPPKPHVPRSVMECHGRGRPRAAEHPFLLLAAGHPDENATAPDISRKPLDEVVTYV